MLLLKLNLVTLTLLCLVFTSCSKDDSIQHDSENYTINLELVEKNNDELALDILSQINNHRSSLGLNPLILDIQHTSAFAVSHSLHMIEVEALNHDNFSYRSEAIKFHKGAKTVNEIVAYGHETAEEVVNAWLSSPNHNVIIEGNFTHTGFGIVKSTEDRNYFTQIFYKK